MKKMLMFAVAVVLFCSVAMAQTYTQGAGITGIDKLGAHQNGGRGCVGCHAPHSGVRGNGGALTVTSVLTSNPNSGNATGFEYSWSNQPDDDGEIKGDEALWGQDIGPLVGLELETGGGEFIIDLDETRPRILNGVIFCLSCHDGNVAKGAMMTNQSFEQAAGLLPPSYGSQPIPTLLGDDGGPTAGNYANDHPIGPLANIGTLSGIRGQLEFDNVTANTNPSPARIVMKTSASSQFQAFYANYGLPIVNGRTGSGWVVEPGMASSNEAYIVCTTCHTPHTMHVYNASTSNSNFIAGGTGTFPSYFFVSSPYNPGANTARGTRASSATQFCRQCHFTGAGGSNEGSNILGIATAF